MGLNLLLFTFGSLILLVFVDVFESWYSQFLKRIFPRATMQYLLLKLMWVILCIFFWLHFVIRRIPDQFDVSYLIFVGFIYSIKGLIGSFLPRKTKGT